MGIAFVLVGCAGARHYQPPMPDGVDAARILKTARDQMGVRYCTGGSSPSSGFDCSGFIHWVFLQNGIVLPRQSEDQFQVGRPVKSGQWMAGDLVFFEIEKKGASHVGLYVRDGWFIHCSSTGGCVREDNLEEKYWRKHYLGARRVLLN